jgi:glyoxylase-like metal-dependent hydrolase (beta-lactamase superfamily II)
MIFRHFRLDINEANVFVVGCEATKEALLVDVGDLDPRIEDFLEEHTLRLTTIFITHDHYDHTGGLGRVVAEHDVKVIRGNRGAAYQNHMASHGDEVRVGNLAGKVLAVPGHTPDSLCLVLPGMVFTGDALFAGSVGGTSSPSHAREQLTALRKHVLSLPDDYEIHTGHGPSSTVGIERNYNPFFV